MGQRENSNRHASLDEEKERGAGRRNDRTPEREAIKDAMDPVATKGETGGAFGNGAANDPDGRATASQGGGGGGGAQSPGKDNHLTTGASKVAETHKSS